MLNIEEIKALIPHRYPFLLVDKVVELEAGKRAVGIKNVTANEEFFNGHFPSYAVMPGVLIVESLAQVAGLTVAKAMKGQTKLVYLPRLMAVNSKGQSVQVINYV